MQDIMGKECFDGQPEQTTLVIGGKASELEKEL